MILAGDTSRFDAKLPIAGQAGCRLALLRRSGLRIAGGASQGNSSHGEPLLRRHIVAPPCYTLRHNALLRRLRHAPHHHVCRYGATLHTAGYSSLCPASLRNAGDVPLRVSSQFVSRHTQRRLHIASLRVSLSGSAKSSQAYHRFPTRIGTPHNSWQASRFRVRTASPVSAHRCLTTLRRHRI